MGTCSTSSHTIWAGVTLPSTAPKEIMAAPAAKALSISSGRSSSMNDLQGQSLLSPVRKCSASSHLSARASSSGRSAAGSPAYCDCTKLLVHCLLYSSAQPDVHIQKLMLPGRECAGLVWKTSCIA